MQHDVYMILHRPLLLQTRPAANYMHSKSCKKSLAMLCQHVGPIHGPSSTHDKPYSCHDARDHQPRGTVTRNCTTLPVQSLNRIRNDFTEARAGDHPWFAYETMLMPISL